MFDWMAGKCSGEVVVTRTVPKRKAGQENTLEMEVDFVSALQPDDDQVSMFPGLKGALRYLDTKQMSHVTTKAQLVEKAVSVSMMDTDGLSVLSWEEGEIRFVKLPLTDGKNKATTARVVFPQLTEEDAGKVIAQLGRTVSLQSMRSVPTPAELNNADPVVGEIVSAADDDGGTITGCVVAIDGGRVELDDFGDSHFVTLDQVVLTTKLVSDDDDLVPDHLGAYAEGMEKIGARPSYAQLWDAIVMGAAEGDVAPASAAATYLNAKVVERAINAAVESIEAA